jgi:DNA/RNA endonuclease G (NUC1)
VRTPRAFWKVIIGESSHIAWIIPNISSAKRGKLDDYLVPLGKIESETSNRFQVIGADEKTAKEQTSWKLSEGCDLG